MLNIKRCFSLIVFLCIFFIIGGVGCSQVFQDNSFSNNVQSESELIKPKPKLVFVKYRDLPVDVGQEQFEYLNTTGSSLVNGAWYDIENKYMIIKLKNTYYHYCGLPGYVWVNFGKSNSFGSFYSSQLKGSYDCRSNFVPSYLK